MLLTTCTHLKLKIDVTLQPHQQPHVVNAYLFWNFELSKPAKHQPLETSDTTNNIISIIIATQLANHDDARPTICTVQEGDRGKPQAQSKAD